MPLFGRMLAGPVPMALESVLRWGGKWLVEPGVGFPTGITGGG